MTEEWVRSPDQQALLEAQAIVDGQPKADIVVRRYGGVPEQLLIRGGLALRGALQLSLLLCERLLVGLVRDLVRQPPIGQAIDGWIRPLQFLLGGHGRSPSALSPDRLVDTI
jgi:hypothetical protein